MNYLAHSYLADLTSTSLVGSIMGDFVHGPLEGRYPAEIERGIRLHRRIDSYTDLHPVVQAARRRMHPPFRRYGGILIDMFFDHFLALNWQDYHRQPIEVFADDFYRQMDEQSDLFGDRLQLSLDYMRKRDLLVSYREIAGIERALKGLSTRLTRENPLADGVSLLRNDYDQFEQDFRVFFPDLVQFANKTAGEL